MGLDPELVGKLLQASITGAGLTFTIYAFLLPRAGPILKRRAEVREEVRKDLVTKANADTEEGIEDLARRFSQLSAFPWILGPGILVVFVLYGSSSILTWFWMFHRESCRGEAWEWWVANLFCIATLAFIALGFLVIKETVLPLQQLWTLLKKQAHQRSKKEGGLG